MKLKTIVKANTTIANIAKDQSIGAHLAYWFAKFLDATQSDVDFYTNGLRKLFEEYEVTENEDGGLRVGVEKPGETKAAEEFLKKVDDLQNTEARDPGIYFSLSEINSELKVTLQQMYPLLDFIKEND